MLQNMPQIGSHAPQIKAYGVRWVTVAPSGIIMRDTNFLVNAWKRTQNANDDWSEADDIQQLTNLQRMVALWRNG